MARSTGSTPPKTDAKQRGSRTVGAALLASLMTHQPCTWTVVCNAINLKFNGAPATGWRDALRAAGLLRIVGYTTHNGTIYELQAPFARPDAPPPVRDRSPAVARKYAMECARSRRKRARARELREQARLAAPLTQGPSIDRMLHGLS